MRQQGRNPPAHLFLFDLRQYLLAWRAQNDVSLHQKQGERMSNNASNNIRSVVLLGHCGVGKTTLG